LNLFIKSFINIIESKSEIVLKSKMSCDRTTEFISTIKSMESKNQLVANELRSRKKLNGYGHSGVVYNPEYLSFMRGSRSVAKDLFITFQKLEKLNELAKKRNIFGDEDASSDLNELVYIIKQDINSLNQQIENLRKQQVSRLNVAKSNVDNHSKNVILSLQQKLATMSSSFKNTLEIRTQNMQQQKMRREQFTSSPSLPPVKNNTNIIDFGDGPTSSSSSDQNQTQLLLYEDNTHQYLAERASTMQTIESTIVELGTIFNQLATMVQQQDEMITRIDANIVDTSLNVEAAHQSLLRYFQSISSNRWLMLKVFGVLFVFFIVFVMLI